MQNRVDPAAFALLASLDVRQTGNLILRRTRALAQCPSASEP